MDHEDASVEPDRAKPTALLAVQEHDLIGGK
jgi:hypothetical protein